MNVAYILYILYGCVVEPLLLELCPLQGGLYSHQGGSLLQVPHRYSMSWISLTLNIITIYISL
jgi:hypothetical protein